MGYYYLYVTDDETEAHGDEETYPFTAKPKFKHQRSNSNVYILHWDIASLKDGVTKSYNQCT